MSRRLRFLLLASLCHCIIVKSKALPITGRDKTVALPHVATPSVSDTSQLLDKREKDTEKEGDTTDKAPAIPDKPPAITDIITDIYTDILSRGEKDFFIAVFPYLSKHGEINNYRARMLSGKSAESVKKYFAKLVSVGLLQAQGEKKGRVYRLAEFDSRDA